MNSDGEENSAIKSSSHEETELYNEDGEMSTNPRPRKPSRYVQKEHPESQNIGYQVLGVQTRRKFVGS